MGLRVSREKIEIQAGFKRILFLPTGKACSNKYMKEPKWDHIHLF